MKESVMAEVTLDKQLKRLNDARSKVDNLKAERQKLEGKIEAQKKVMAELEKKSQEQFGCGVDDLENLATSLEAEAEKLLKDVEKILNTEAA
jgi:predicted RNase H-like nuclease (RuvC/YqgF family)